MDWPCVCFTKAPLPVPTLYLVTTEPNPHLNPVPDLKLWGGCSLNVATHTPSGPACTNPSLEFPVEFACLLFSCFLQGVNSVAFLPEFMPLLFIYLVIRRTYSRTISDRFFCDFLKARCATRKRQRGARKARIENSVFSDHGRLRFARLILATCQPMFNACVARRSGRSYMMFHHCAEPKHTS